MKTIHTYKSYDTHECTSIGSMLELRGDGSIKCTSRSCWAGSRTGRVILTPPGTIAIPTGVGDDIPDMDALLVSWLESQQGEEPAGRLLRVGYTVRS